MKLKHLLLSFGLIATLMTSCTFDKAEVPAPSVPVSDTCTGAPVTHTVQVANNVFIPDSVVACSGDTIKWVLTQGTHTTTSTNIPGGAISWDQFMSSTGVTTFTYVVVVSGNYDYVCTIHPTMVGRIVVK